MTDDSGFFPGIFIGFIGAAVLSWMGWSAYVDLLKKEAIEHGAAQWIVNQKTGDTRFAWKEIKP